jgi:hypothetical protein
MSGKKMEDVRKANDERSQREVRILPALIGASPRRRTYQS